MQWLYGRNHGLGDVYIWESDRKRYNANTRISPWFSNKANVWPHGEYHFKDEQGPSDKVLFSIRNDDHHWKQYEWFALRKGEGITRAGLGRSNRSVEAFVYCVLGAQVNVRSSIVGTSGGSEEAKQEFIKLFESAVIEEDISQSVQRYQLSVQEAKLRLDFAIAPGIWLMPSNLIINTSSVVGYNNELLRASDRMSFGMNDSVNKSNKSVGTKHNLGSSKVKLPHRADVHEGSVEQSQKPETNVVIHSKTSVNKRAPTISSHDVNLTALTVAAAGMGWYLFR